MPVICAWHTLLHLRVAIRVANRHVIAVTVAAPMVTQVNLRGVIAFTFTA
jgi:hypothetical protein